LRIGDFTGCGINTRLDGCGPDLIKGGTRQNTVHDFDCSSVGVVMIAARHGARGLPPIIKAITPRPYGHFPP
jgi:hypothetical protein